jgi:eukaryotic-like serine/threonine-protein kinase
MATRRMLRRHVSTPSPTSQGSGAGQSMPIDVMQQTCRRVGTVGLVAAGLWTFSLVMNGVAARLMGHPAMIEDLWPYPALPIAVAGLVTSGLMVYLAGRLGDRPDLLLDLSAGFLVLTCMLVALITQWIPAAISPRVSWLCILILIYPAIIPSTPTRSLVVSVLAASTDPVALWITHLRGVGFEHTVFYYVWAFLPTYICAVIAVVPAKVIRGLGQQVRRARELGSYRLEEVLGKGGMGEVYRASHQMLARPAAVKVIRAEVLGQSSAQGARVILERFRREAEAAASLRSPHTINLYDFGAAQDGTFFLVMELLDGLDLQSLVERFGPLPPERTIHLLRQACDSLGEAHARGLIHRDIKPSNIFTCRVGLAVDFVKVLDFGLVKTQHDQARHEPLLTAPDATTGTPAYMAPEVVRGDAVVDHRVDIYALGCVAYWLLTGRLVFEAPNALQVMFHHAQTPPVPPSERLELPIPPALDALVLACLAKRPEDRPATVLEVSRALAAAGNGEPWTDDRAHRWWQRHRPESSRPAGACCDGLTLTKALASDRAPDSADAAVPEGANR